MQFPKVVPKDLHTFCRAEKYIGRSIEVVITASTRNRVYQKWYRGFESHLLRHGKVLRSQNLAFCFTYCLLNDNKVLCEKQKLYNKAADHRSAAFMHSWAMLLVNYIFGCLNFSICIHDYIFYHQLFNR